LEFRKRENMPRRNGILVVGNSLTINAIRKIALEEAGHEVVTTFGISAAVEAASRTHFDAAVIDGYLSSEEARNLLTTLRSLSIPSILMTPRDTPADIISLADVHLHLEDAPWLARLIDSLLHNALPTRMEKVSLGIGDEMANLGEHLAWLFSNDEQFERAVRFLEVGFEHGDTGMVYGDAIDNERMADILAAHGLDRRELLDSGKLMFLDVATFIGLGDAWMDKAREVINSCPSVVRILGCGGTLRFPWPSDEAFFRYEEQVNTVVRGTRCVTVCMYDLNNVSGKRLLYGGIDKHRAVVTPAGVLKGHRFIEGA
jgi:CheY-like chemotaxis protein